MKQLKLLEKKETITSLELLQQINIFRKEGKEQNDLRHDTLRDIIKDEFSEEILSQNILEKSISSGGRPILSYELTLSQAKQVLVRESKFVRKAVIQYIEKLESRLNNNHKLPTTFKEALIELVSKVEEIEQLQLENQIKTQQIAEFEPIVEYHDTILQSRDLMTITNIASDFGLTGIKLNKILKEEKIQHKKNNLWILNVKYINKGYTKTKTTKYNKSNGTTGINVHTYWTQKGRLFLYDLLKGNGYLPNIEKEEVVK